MVNRSRVIELVDRAVSFSIRIPQSEIEDTAPVANLSTELSLESAGRIRTAAGIILQVTKALEHAHSVGITHRDIKPSNLMLDVDGHVWVTDFGLAQIETEAGLERVHRCGLELHGWHRPRSRCTAG